MPRSFPPSFFSELIKEERNTSLITGIIKQQLVSKKEHGRTDLFFVDLRPAHWLSKKEKTNEARALVGCPGGGQGCTRWWCPSCPCRSSFVDELSSLFVAGLSRRNRKEHPPILKRGSLKQRTHTYERGGLDHEHSHPHPHHTYPHPAKREKHMVSCLPDGKGKA